ncbi:hypothetical protein KAK06_08465 [Ideonella sp. 4Y11]|uniref:Uncharacterized protein n=1 Tax=Ideonella aquatica TaxID=2824119 RepID=A0A941BFP8_9BURK|nr:hypothetical protein [Ideonella aquatica]MBQ0958991.1 hypothetical protein [Ideonella aquatica]
MTGTDELLAQRRSVARYAWWITAGIAVLCVLVPFFYAFTRPGGAPDQFNAAANLAELVGMAGSLSTLSFLVVAVMFRENGPAARRRLPAAMKQALDEGLILTAGYWLLFIAMSSTGGDGDGILRGWLIILYPPILVAYVMLNSRRGHDRGAIG